MWFPYVISKSIAQVSFNFPIFPRVSTEKSFINASWWNSTHLKNSENMWNHHPAKKVALKKNGSTLPNKKPPTTTVPPLFQPSFARVLCTNLGGEAPRCHEAFPTVSANKNPLLFRTPQKINKWFFSPKTGVFLQNKFKTLVKSSESHGDWKKKQNKRQS